MHNSSDMKAMEELGVTSIHCLPVRIIFQDKPNTIKQKSPYQTKQNKQV